MFIEIGAFVFITFLSSWCIWGYILWSGSSTQLLFWIAGFGPTLTAISLTALRTKMKGIRDLFRPRSHVKIKWYLFSLLGPLVLFITALLINIGLGGDWPHYIDEVHFVTSLEQWPIIFIVYLYIFIFSALGEEIGWRSYALPRLQASFTPFTSSLILGVIWAFWHLPLFWISNTIQNQLPIGWFLLQIVGSTFLYTWLFNKTSGSLMISLLLHTSSNAAIGLLPVLALDNHGSLRPLWLAVFLLWIVVGFVLWFDRANFFSNSITRENLPI